MRPMLTKKEVAAFAGKHPETIMRDVRAGRFPRPIKSGPEKGCVCRWDQADLDAWISERKAQRP